MDAAAIILVAAYLSLTWELCVWRVPSVASTAQLLGRAPSAARELATARGLPAWLKLARFGAPAVFHVALYAQPLLAVFWPAVLRPLLPIEAMAITPVRVLGAILVVGGRGLTLRAVAVLRARVDRADIQTTGPYAWSRNPALVGLYLFLLGAVCLAPAWLLFGACLLHMAWMHGRVRLEESHLLSVAGESYRAYRARVPRYVGFRSSGTSDMRVPR